MKLIYLVIAAMLVLTACKEQKSVTDITSTLNFPQDYVGIYKGTLTITSSNGDEHIPMEFHLGTTTDSTKYDYKIYYGTERAERAYTLERTHNPHLFLVDERNGIILESGFTNNTLYSTYQVAGNLINSTEQFYNDRMEFHLTMARVQDTSLTGDTSSAIVKNYPLSIMQHATLMKQSIK